MKLSVIKTILILLTITYVPLIGQTDWELIFSDEFNDGSSQKWHLEPGWKVKQLVDENFVLSGEGHYWANCLRGDTWYDYQFKCRFSIQQGVMHFNFRLSENGRFMLSVAPDEMQLIRDDNWGIYTPLGSKPISIATDVWNSLEVIADYKSIRIYINENLEMQVYDEFALSQGTIAFETLDDALFFIDDIEVFGPPSSEPPEGYSWMKTSGPPGGLGYDIRIHPQEQNIMYVTDNPSGVNKSYDGGKTWQQRNEGINVRAGESGEAIPVFSLTIDPGNPQILWCGTQNSKGIFKSINGGESWNRKDNGVTEGDEISFRGFAIHPENSDIVFAAAEIATEFQGKEFNKTKGKIYKTINGGESWYSVWAGNNLARVLLFDYNQPDTLYCTTGIFDREAFDSDFSASIPAGEGILKSTNGGETWVQANKGLNNLYVGYMEMHPENPRILYAAVGAGVYYSGGGIYKTTNGGESWISCRGNDEPFTTLAVSSSNPEVIYGFSGACIRSNDGGSTWTQYNGIDGGLWGPPGINPGIPISAVVVPSDENKLFVNNYNGGNFYSSDGAQSWVNASRGYTGADIRDIKCNPENPAEVIAVGRMGAYKSENGGLDWYGITYQPVGTDFLRLSEHSDSFDKIIGAVDCSFSIVISNNGGASWEFKNVFDNPEAIDDVGFHTVSEVKASKQNDDIIYIGFSHIMNVGNIEPDGTAAMGMYKTVDGGNTWTEINKGLESTSKIITALTLHPQSADTLFIGTLLDGIFKSVNGGDSWYPVNNGLGSSDIRAIAIDPGNPKKLYAGTGNGYGIYISENGGELWAEYNAGIKLLCPTYLSSAGRVTQGMNLDVPPQFVPKPGYSHVPWTKITEIKINPINTQHVYAADFNTGIYFSDDGGINWANISKGLSMKTVTSMTLSDDGEVLYAGTAGSGVNRMVLGERAPQMLYTFPGTEDTITIYKDQSLEFEFACFDLNNDTLRYQWQLNNSLLEGINSPSYNFNSDTTGIIALHVTASDSKAELETSWIIKVIDLPNTIYSSDYKNSKNVIHIYPNPMRDHTNIELYLTESSDILVSIYTIHGTMIREFLLKEQVEGFHTIRWNGQSDSGSQIADGVYICRFVITNNNGRLIQERKISCHRNAY